ncbi:MAG: hypothetical protein WAM60_08370 [Candidatus Promineifilaceae bacterium]
MNEILAKKHPRRKFSGVFVSALLASLMVLTIFQTIKAQEGIREQVLPPDLSGSEKSVSFSQAVPGTVLHYSIVISNSGDLPAADVVVTDTLVSELTYQTDSLDVVGGGLFGEDNGVITWTGAVNNSSEIIINFNAVLDSGLSGGEVITNTADINYNGSTIERSATTTVITDVAYFLPLVFKPVPTPDIFLNPVGRPNSDNVWTTSWLVSDETYVTGYELQEATLGDFSNATTINVPVGTTSAARSHELSIHNLYYYRVRAVGGFGATEWSNTQYIRGGYRDSFNDSSSGWTMRRQDTDTVVNDSYYRDGRLVLEMDSSYDYQIVSSLAPAPAPPYQIESRIQLVGVDNLHSYGIIFGGDWNGQPCPNNDYSSCFNHYYRLNVIWSGNLNNRLTVQLKRIYYHDENNVGRGVDLAPTRTVEVNPPAQGFQTWVIQVFPNGDIRVRVNGNLVFSVNDTHYVQNPFFGAFSSTDEYTGLEAEFEYFEASYLD